MYKTAKTIFIEKTYEEWNGYISHTPVVVAAKA